MIPRLLAGMACVAIALGPPVGAAAPAGTDPGPFAHLNCACDQPDPPGGVTPRDAMNQGIRQGLSAPPAAE